VLLWFPKFALSVPQCDCDFGNGALALAAIVIHKRERAHIIRTTPVIVLSAKNLSAQASLLLLM